MIILLQEVLICIGSADTGPVDAAGPASGSLLASCSVTDPYRRLL